MSTPFGACRRKRFTAASVAALVTTVCLGAWVLCAPTVSIAASGDAGAAAAKLEILHQRAIARLADDDDVATDAATQYAVSPEKAARLGQLFAIAQGLAITRQSYIELQTHNGHPFYALRMGSLWVYVDAVTGGVTL